MLSILFAIITACLIWWASTGLLLWIIKYAENSEARGAVNAQRKSALFGFPVFLISAYGLYVTADHAGMMAEYLAFLSAIGVWGWLELAFLTGFLTGPKPINARIGAQGWERFWRAWATIAYNELSLILVVIAILAWGLDSPNVIGMWTFLTLFLARVSAKLNLFLGVPNINTEFLPKSMDYLGSHFRKGKATAFFPVSIVFLSLLSAYWIVSAARAYGHGSVVGDLLLATLTLLALFEHWMMVLPHGDARLWAWMLPAQRKTAQEETPANSMPAE